MWSYREAIKHRITKECIDVKSSTIEVVALDYPHNSKKDNDQGGEEKNKKFQNSELNLGDDRGCNQGLRTLKESTEICITSKGVGIEGKTGNLIAETEKVYKFYFCDCEETNYTLISSRKACPNCSDANYTMISSRHFYTMIGKIISSRKCCNKVLKHLFQISSEMKFDGNNLQNEYGNKHNDTKFTTISSRSYGNMIERMLSSAMYNNLPYSSACKNNNENGLDGKVHEHKHETNKKVRWFRTPFKKISSRNDYFTPQNHSQNENGDYENNINKNQDGIMNVEHKISHPRIGYFNKTSNTIAEQKVGTPGLEKLTKDDITYPLSPVFVRSTKKKKSRCLKCSKNVGLNGIACKCRGLFCAIHRYTDRHECQYDWKDDGAKEIAKNNPVVSGEKIRKI